MSLVNTKSALRAYLEKRLSQEELKEVSLLIAQMTAAAVREDREKKREPDIWEKLSRGIFNTGA